MDVGIVTTSVDRSTNIGIKYDVSLDYYWLRTMPYFNNNQDTTKRLRPVIIP